MLDGKMKREKERQSEIKRKNQKDSWKERKKEI